MRIQAIQRLAVEFVTAGLTVRRPHARGLKLT